MFVSARFAVTRSPTSVGFPVHAANVRSAAAQWSENRQGDRTMPKGDRTGPMGTGAMRGRAAGFCAGFDMPGYTNTAVSGGFRMRINRINQGWNARWAGSRRRRQRALSQDRQGRGYFGDHPIQSLASNPESEKEFLMMRSTALQSELDAIKKRLDEIGGQETSS